eukprot:179708_1
MSNPTALSLWVTFVFATVLCLAEETVLRVGMSTGGSPGQSPGEHTITVWFKQRVYRCFNTPSSTNTDYYCLPFCLGFDDTSAVDGAKILFDNDHIDASIYTRIWIKTTEAEYGITDSCVPDSATIGGYYGGLTGPGSCGSGYTNRPLCVDNEVYTSGGSCWPPQQMLYFDTTQPDVFIDNAVWEDATSFVVSTFDDCGEEVLTQIAVTTRSSPGDSVGEHTITVWFQQKVYQCLITPRAVGTTYTCDPSFIGCDDTADSDGAKILIDNTHGDASLFSRIWITTTLITDGSQREYGITDVCIPDSATIGGYYDGLTGSGSCGSGTTNRIFCIDGEGYTSSGSCWPPQQMLYFDTTQPNADIDNAVWEDAQSFVISAGECGTCGSVGLGLARPHACECKAACVDTDEFCNTMDFVLNALRVTGVGTCSGSLTCCCSCPNCPGFAEL